MCDNKWISVNDKLPEERMIPVHVIVGRSESMGCPSSMESEYRDGKFLVFSPLKKCYQEFVDPTHWQPLPEPPNV